MCPWPLTHQPDDSVPVCLPGSVPTASVSGLSQITSSSPYISNQVAATNKLMLSSYHITSHQRLSRGGEHHI